MITRTELKWLTIW